MKIKVYVVLVTAVSLMLMGTRTIFSQEPGAPGGPAETKNEAIENVTIPDTQTEPDTQWLWGEVISLDTQNNSFVVRYLDYDTDQEKEMTINVDDKTTYESIKSLDEIRPRDTLSIDYVVSADGKTIARNISVEKPEETAIPEQGATLETTPPENPQAVMQ